MRKGYMWLAAMVAGCSAPAIKQGQPFDENVFLEQRGRDAAREKAENVQAMRDYPDAGITPDMPRGEREKRIAADNERKVMESVEKIKRIGDNLPPMR